jgi:transposase-like protein
VHPGHVFQRARIHQTRPNAYLRWEAEEDERLVAESRGGKTITEMADLHGRGESAILSRLVKLQHVDGDSKPPGEADVR